MCKCDDLKNTIIQILANYKINDMKKTQITIDIELDENNVPEKMTWNAEDGGIEKEETKATMISVWDDAKKEALRIDLWTKDMPVDDMKMFLHQILISLSNTYERATGEEDVAQWMEEMAEEFAQKAAIKM
ncbi:protein involved in gliding motility GldC [Kaistella chaponensis]|uniref:Protein involved in gliding motility GldC n=2 Tax=Kaistella chaponensis TaxID=713588 RepID=A0A1N7NJG5_9FLAO|nr:protein involved in gliding motility GldC [Kaistella chaponensis]